jgi:geranylgeranyl transferase type-2 subunit alpha
MKELQIRREREAEGKGDTSTTAATTTLALLEKALLVNPDPSNLWNHRREVLLVQLEKAGGEDEESKSKILETERYLTQSSLQRNPKSYGAWYHRKWIVHFLKASPQILQEEIQLTSQFLLLDERNFHCWNYRRYVVACLAQAWNGEWNVLEKKEPTSTIVSLMGPQIASTVSALSESPAKQTIPDDWLQSEFDFTTTKIKDNFSNFSAFHYRSQLLEYIGEDKSLVEKILDNEFQIIEDAVCTEPDDQTAWWYHAILMDKIIEAGNDDEMKSLLRARLQEQTELFRELLDDSPGGKWIMLGLLKVASTLQQLDDNDDRTTTIKQEQKSMLERLMKIDKDRSKRYEELSQQLQKL